MANLVIVESPSKATAIKKYLGSNYKVIASKGHVRETGNVRRFYADRLHSGMIEPPQPPQKEG